MGNVVIFGDSILRGVLLSDGKYSISKSIAWDIIEEKLDIKIKNLSKMGSTLPKSVSSIKSYIEKNSAEIHRVVLEYGGNDSDYDWQQVAERASKTHTPKTDYKLFMSTLCELIEFIIDKGIEVTLMTLPPINAGLYFKWISRNSDKIDKENILFFLGDIEIIYRRQEMYSNVFMKVAHLYKLDLVDARINFLSHDNYTSLLCEDGIHPNEKGEELIVESFLKFYEQKRSKQ